jgi:hypothetical protein
LAQQQHDAWFAEYVSLKSWLQKDANGCKMLQKVAKSCNVQKINNKYKK